MTILITKEASKDIVEVVFNGDKQLVGIGVRDPYVRQSQMREAMQQRTEVPSFEGLSIFYRPKLPDGTLAETANEIFMPTSNVVGLLKFAMETINKSIEITDIS